MSCGVSGPKRLSGHTPKIPEGNKRRGSEGEKLLMEEKTELQLAVTSQRRMLVHPAPWIMNLNCFARVVQWNQAALLAEWGRVTTECWTGTFQVSITGCRKFLSTIPVLFMVVDECVVTLHPEMPQRPEGDSPVVGCNRLTLIMLISDLSESLLSPLPVSCLRTWDEITADCFQLPSRFHWAAYLSLWSSLRPERRTDFIIHSHSASRRSCWGGNLAPSI